MAHNVGVLMMLPLFIGLVIVVGAVCVVLVAILSRASVGMLTIMALVVWLAICGWWLL